MRDRTCVIGFGVSEYFMRTILVIDDDPVFQGAAQSLLADAGYRVLLAPDGIRATRMIEELRGKIDLAIVDLSLPGVNGFELIGNISRRPNSVKVIATTSVFKDAQLESTTVLGAHAVIRKPASAKVLPRKQWLGTVQQLIGEP